MSLLEIAWNVFPQQWANPVSSSSHAGLITQIGRAAYRLESLGLTLVSPPATSSDFARVYLSGAGEQYAEGIVTTHLIA